MGYIELNGEWAIENNVREIHADKDTPYIMFLTFPDKDYIDQFGFITEDDLIPEKCLDMEICFN